MKFISFGLLLVLSIIEAVNIYKSIPKKAIPWAGKIPYSDDQSVVCNGIYYLADCNNDGVHIAISATKHNVLGNISFLNATELEQPAFNPFDGDFYISAPSIPSTAAEGGEIFILDKVNLRVSKAYYALKCIPTGIVFGLPNLFFTGCSQGQILKYSYAVSYVMDVTTGAIIGNISGLSGIDQVAYSSFTNCYYAAAVANRARGTINEATMPQLEVVSDATNILLQTFVTYNSTDHVLAVYNANGDLYVLVQAQGIVVYALTSTVTNAPGSVSASATPTKTTAPAALTPSAVDVVVASFTVELGLMTFAVLLL